MMTLFALLTGCSGRPTPAPVIEVSQAGSFRDLPEKSTYKVQQGDTLFSIAWYSGNDYRDLARLNNIRPPYRIYPGQKLRLKPSPKTTDTNTSDTGQTRKLKPNQSVDRTKKQAYGGKKAVNKSSQESKQQAFPEVVNGWAWPANGKVIATFSLQDDGNKGIDIANTIGSPVRAAAKGKVVYTGDALRGFGNLVIIKHTDAYLTAYAHNRKILVKEQQWVEAGQHIAEMGDSGTSRVKLHFEVRHKGKSVNPMRYLPQR
ncbi:peptidoglycan DD-metalloendopeptidase family protein [Saliniradius amylolyticus]|nr:peptidoglycan DD-metalloendopeptidase family protein [Saliniradius amylolyticus]